MYTAVPLTQWYDWMEKAGVVLHAGTECIVLPGAERIPIDVTHEVFLLVSENYKKRCAKRDELRAQLKALDE